MKYPNDEYRAREAQARTWAQNLARHAGWTFASQVTLLPPVLRQGFCDPDADLVVMGMVEDLPRGVISAVSEMRYAALMLQPCVTIAGALTCYFTLLRCAGGKVHSHSGLQLWASRDKGLCLIPDPNGLDPTGQCFALERRGIWPSDRPYAGIGQTAHGLIRGAEILMLS